jgi:hypothetical protein
MTGCNLLRTRPKLATSSYFKALQSLYVASHKFRYFLLYCGVRCAALLTVIVLLNSFLRAENQPSLPVVRWAENTSNCSIRHGDDGRTYYELSSPTFEIILAVDPKELEKIRHRATPLLTVFLNFTYKGKGEFEIHQRRFALEFSKHLQVLKMSLEPNDIVQRLQEDVENLTDQVERHEVRKHPEQKEQKEAELQARLKDYTEMMDFVSTQSLRYAVLSPSKLAISGWVFFSVKDRWIGPWQKPEQFILRLPVGKVIVEFPFSLPPQGGAVELRRRSPEPSQ